MPIRTDKLSRLLKRSGIMTTTQKISKPDFKKEIEVASTLTVCLLLGSNIIYSLKNFFKIKTFPINGDMPPYREKKIPGSSNKIKASFPYRLANNDGCMKPHKHDHVKRPGYTIIEWFANTISMSMRDWRRMLLLVPFFPGYTEVGARDNKLSDIFNALPQDGNGMEFIFLIALSLLIPIIISLGPIFSIFYTYTGAIAVDNGILYTFIFTFLIPILLLVVTPLIITYQISRLLVILLLKPLITFDGWSNLLRTFVKFIGLPLTIFSIYLLIKYHVLDGDTKIAGWTVIFVVALYWLYKMIVPKWVIAYLIGTRQHED